MIDLAGFIFAILPIALSPGTSLTLALRNVTLSGIWGSIKIILGTGLGIGVHALLVGAGISAVLSSNELAMSTLRALGIIFLLYLGIKFLISGIQPSKYNLDVNGGLTGINAAFSLNIFNVKAMLLYLTVAPTFAGVEMINYFILSVIHIAIMAIWILLCSAILVIAKENFKIQTVSSIINIIGGAFLVFTSYNSALEYYNSQLKR